MIFTAQWWNPFASLPALLKYSVVSVIAATIFGALVILIQYYLLVSIIFPLPPRADSRAPKTIWRRIFPFLFKNPPISPKAPKSLEELIGNAQAKQEIKEVIDMIANPDKYRDSGAEVPKGMLFVGPPGVGKTLFARAIANEVGIPFYVVEGSGLSGLIMGLGVLKLKTLFRKLRRHERAILFIDEIDSMGARRRSDMGFGGQSDMNMTLNTLLTEMDGFVSSSILVIGATNNDGILDPALMRAGRMDRRIYFQSPTIEERVDIFKYYLAKVACAENIDLEALAKLTVNFSPAEIANAVNEAALIGSRPGGPGKVTTDIMKQALDRISVGLERSLVGSGVELITGDPSIRLSDVVGIDDVKQDISEIIDFLKRGDELRTIGAKLPKGFLMIGPPGVGKTMLAKAIANEAGVPFFGLSAPYLLSKARGEGSGRIKALYSQARKSPASIVFIDEIDSIGGGETHVEGMGNQRTEELNQMLVELDGFGHSNVITIGATNREQQLDSAFMRSGRFDRKVYIGLPDAEARKKIFQKYLAAIKISAEPDLEKLSKETINFSGADIAACVNEAAILAVRARRTTVEEKDLEEAAAKISVTAGHKLNTSGISLCRVPDVDIKLDDIKGMDEAKAEASEVVALLKHMDIVASSGLKAPKGVLLVGPPGTGKTMLAKAIANEAGVPFYALTGSDFVQVWVGLGAQRVRAVYEQARRSGKPAIVFIDEIDGLGHARGVDHGAGGKQEHNQTLNQFLAELDGFGKHKVLTIGATNNPNLLDGALLRPGRFDRRIDVPLPNLEGRESIVQSYLKKTSYDDSVNARDVARMTVYSSGADLANIVNEAGLIAIRHGRLKINQEDLIQAIQRQQFGMSFSRHVLIDELRTTAYHEAGHAIVCYYRNKRDRIQVVTVVPSGSALGYVWPVRKEDYFKVTRDEYLVQIEISLGGYAAERLVNETTASGVSSDLRNVAGIARAMVRDYGMGSWKFNTEVAFTNSAQGLFNPEYNASSETQREIELEIKQIVDGCLTSVETILRARRPQLDRLAQALIEKETLYYRDVVSILEPERSMTEIDRELEEMAERKLVGKKQIISIDSLSLTGLAGAGGPQPGSLGSPGNGGSGSPSNNNEGAPGTSANNDIPPTCQ